MGSIARSSLRCLAALLLASRASPLSMPPLDGFVGVNVVDLYWDYAGFSSGNASFARASLRLHLRPP